MIIKRMDTDDEINGKANVHYRAWKEAYAGLIDREFLDKRTYEMSQESAFRAFENGISTFVAKNGDSVVGFVDYGPCRDDDLLNEGEVYAIYILEEYYDKGVGYSLMREALANLSDYDPVVVWVLKENERAIRFYTKCGFFPDGKEQVLTLGTDVTELRMILER